MDSSPVIEARGLTKRYGDLEAVRGIDFVVRRGECFGFLGPNGAGKTTTMRMIYRATPLGGGSLRVLGLDVGAGANDREIKRRLGVVPQEDSLDQELTVRENLRVFSRFYGLRGAQADARIAELLEASGLAARAESPVLQLSGGMKRRALVARGLIGSPDLVVLDEPTTGLDPQARHELWERLRALKRGGATLLLTTHYMEEAEKLCDRLVVMDRGLIVAEGTPAALIAERVSPYVVEVRLEEAGVQPAEAAPLVERAARAQVLGDRLLLYTRDGEDLIARTAHALPRLEATLRRATLEDVFLAITGRGLG